MSKQAKTILIIIVILVAAYFFMNNSTTSVSPSTTGTTGGSSATPGGLPVGTPATQSGPPTSVPPMSQTASVSQPATVSQQPSQGITETIQTPVALSGSPTVFSAGTTDAQTQGDNSQAATPSTSNVLSGYPSGFQTWAASLGPLNYAQLMKVLPAMSTTDVNFINNEVVNNMWGQPSQVAQWNAFTKTYGFPVSGSFSR